MLVFTYGTLRRGECNHHLLAGSRYLGPAVTAPHYALYSLGHFPGATAGKSRLRGEVYAVDDVCLARLDRLEGCPERYRRTQLDTPYGRAWIYLYNLSLAGGHRLVSGDWVARKADECLHYFAYGSNMLLARLQQRVPSAVVVESARVRGHQLRFHKQGRDGSGKCDLFHTGAPEHEVHGVLYTMHRRHKLELDAIEGLGDGYAEKMVSVGSRTGVFEAHTYVAIRMGDNLRPFDWYLAFVLAGAQENRLPAAYIRALEAIEAVRDHDSARRQHNLRILARRLGDLSHD